MTVQGQFRADAVEDDASLLGGRMVVQNKLNALVECQHFFPRCGHFMNDDIRPPGGLDQVFVEPGVARQDHRAAPVIHPVAVGRLDVLTVINRERRDRHALLVEHDSVLRVFPEIEFNPPGRQLFVHEANLDVGIEGLPETIENVRQSFGTDHAHGLGPLAPRWRKPATQPQVG